MKTLVVYDSVFGNTEKVALEIGRGLSQGHEVRTLRVSAVSQLTLEGVQLLVVGSPTRAFRPTNGVKRFLSGLPKGSLTGVKAAAFDTRVDVSAMRSPILRSIVKRGGYAAPAIAKMLRRGGAEEVSDPEGFIVEDSEGPMREGEIERAAQWAHALA